MKYLLKIFVLEDDFIHFGLQTRNEMKLRLISNPQIVEVEWLACACTLPYKHTHKLYPRRIVQ